MASWEQPLLEFFLGNLRNFGLVTVANFVLRVHDWIAMMLLNDGKPRQNIHSDKLRGVNVAMLWPFLDFLRR